MRQRAKALQSAAIQALKGAPAEAVKVPEVYVVANDTTTAVFANRETAEQYAAAWGAAAGITVLAVPLLATAPQLTEKEDGE